VTAPVSPPTRLSRAESQAQTRDRLVAKAREMFLRDGYASTSLERVAEEAGFSKGAVYSNFGGKDDLCLAVLDSIQGEVAEAVLSALDGLSMLRSERRQTWHDRIAGTVVLQWRPEDLIR